MLLGKTELKLVQLNTVFPCTTKSRSVDAKNIRSEISDLCTNKIKQIRIDRAHPAPPITGNMTGKLLTTALWENVEFVTNEQRSVWNPTSDIASFNSRELQPFVYISNNNNNNNNNNNTQIIQRMWNVKTRVIPVIIGATGTISKSFRK